MFLSAALHGEIGLLKLQILFCKNLHSTWLHQILISFRRVQLVLFPFLSWFTNVSFAWGWLIEIEKCSSRLLKIYIWKIWMQIKWEAWGEIYLKYLDADKMRGEVETFLFPVLHWAWPIVHWGEICSLRGVEVYERDARNVVGIPICPRPPEP